MSFKFNNVKPACCAKWLVLPTVYSDALSYGEQLDKFCYQLNQLVENNNILPDFITDMIKEYINSGAIGEVVRDILANYILNVKYPPEGITPAVGDGSADDTAAIQGCIDYAAENGGVVYFPYGSYLTQPLTMKDGVSLFGFDRYSTKLVLKGGATKPLIGGTVADFSIANLTLDGNSGIQVNDVNVVTIIGTNVLFTNLIIKDGYTLVNYVGTGGHFQISNVVFGNAVEKCLLTAGNADVQCENVVFNQLSAVGGISVMDIGTDGGFFNVKSVATCNQCIVVSGNKNKISAIVENASIPVVDNGLQNNIEIYGVSNKEFYSGNKTVNAVDSVETLTGNKTVNAVDSAETLTGNKTVKAVDSAETLTGNKTVNAVDSAETLTGNKTVNAVDSEETLTGNKTVKAVDSEETLTGNKTVKAVDSEETLTGNKTVKAVDSAETLTGNKTVNAVDSAETLTGNKTVNAVDSVETLTGNKTVNAVDSVETLTGNKTVNAVDLKLNITNPIQYKTPTAGNYFDTIPFKDANKHYKVLVENDNTKYITRSTIKTVEDFGAKGDGVSDDTEAIYNALIWAKNNGVDVIFDNSKIYALYAPDSTGGRFTLTDSVDFKGATFKIYNTDATGTYIWGIGKLNENITISANSVVNGAKINVESLYSKTFGLQSDVPISDVEKYQRCVVTDDAGNIVNGDFEYISTNNYNVLNPHSNKTKEVYVKNANLIYDDSNNFGVVPSFIVVRQDHVTVENINISGTVNNINNAGAVLRNFRVSDVKYINITGENVSKSKDSGYIFSFDNCNDVLLLNCYIDNRKTTWGCMASNTLCNFTAINCTLSRLDAHQAMAQNIKLINCIVQDYAIAGGLYNLVFDCCTLTASRFEKDKWYGRVRTDCQLPIGNIYFKNCYFANHDGLQVLQYDTPKQIIENLKYYGSNIVFDGCYGTISNFVRFALNGCKLYEEKLTITIQNCEIKSNLLALIDKGENRIKINKLTICNCRTSHITLNIPANVLTAICVNSTLDQTVTIVGGGTVNNMMIFNNVMSGFQNLNEAVNLLCKNNIITSGLNVVTTPQKYVYRDNISSSESYKQNWAESIKL